MTHLALISFVTKNLHAIIGYIITYCGLIPGKSIHFLQAIHNCDVAWLNRFLPLVHLYLAAPTRCFLSSRKSNSASNLFSWSEPYDPLNIAAASVTYVLVQVLRIQCIFAHLSLVTVLLIPIFDFCTESVKTKFSSFLFMSMTRQLQYMEVWVSIIHVILITMRSKRTFGFKYQTINLSSTNNSSAIW